MRSIAMDIRAILAASEFWFSVVKYVGAGYLAWLGYKMLRPNRTEKAEGQRAESADLVRSESALAICRHSMIDLGLEAFVREQRVEHVIQRIEFLGLIA